MTNSREHYYYHLHGLYNL